MPKTCWDLIPQFTILSVYFVHLNFWIKTWKWIQESQNFAKQNDIISFISVVQQTVWRSKCIHFVCVYSKLYSKYHHSRSIINTCILHSQGREINYCHSWLISTLTLIFRKLTFSTVSMFFRWRYWLVQLFSK